MLFFQLLKQDHKCYLSSSNIIYIMKIKEQTTVRYQGKISLITTIPKTYVKALNIESGDTLEWILNTETEKLELKIIK